MTKLLRNIVCATAVCLASVTSVFAQVPSGTYFINFDAPETAVWDFSGDYLFEQELIGAGQEPVALTFGLPMVHNSLGKITNSGLAILSVGPDFVAANYTLKGNAFGGGDKPTQVSLKVTFSGEDIIAGAQRSFSGKVTYKLYVDPEFHVLSGTAKGNMSIRGIGQMKIDSLVDIAYPANMDGTWQLRMDITPLAKLAGPAQATLSNGRVIPFTLSGKYKDSSNTSTVQGTSGDPEKGCSFKLTFGIDGETGGLDLYTAKGQLLGQKILQ